MSNQHTYRNQLNLTTEAILSEMVVNPLAPDEDAKVAALRKRVDEILPQLSLNQPPFEISKRRVLIHFFWSELLNQLQALENSDFAREALYKQKEYEKE
jgi:hypothetical protein